MENSEKRAWAEKRVQKEKGFYSHLTTYCLVILGLFILNQLTSSEQWWCWPALGWGVGIVAHFSSTFGFTFIFGAKWEKKRIDKLMKEDEN